MQKKIYFLLSFIIQVSVCSAQNLLAIPDTLSGTKFTLNIYDTSNYFYPGFKTKTFGVNASYLGPTLFMNSGDSANIRVVNNLKDTTTIHWHGMHVSAKNDGGPHITIAPNTTWNPKFIVKDYASMFWYHPHLHMHTNLHASLGAAGLIIVRDSIEKKLSLPRSYGIDDFPLVIQSKCFDSNKQIIIENAYDSAIMVNGTLNPYLPVPAQVVRLRLLNASSERIYYFGFQNNKTFYQIGTDGGLLNAPVLLTRLRLAPGERADVLINFSGMLGQTINMMSYASELPSAIYGAKQPGMGPGQTIPGYTSNLLNGSDFKIINFQIVAATSSPIVNIPTSLVVNFPWLPVTANATKTLTFMPVNMGPTAIQGPFMINNAHFDMDVINYSIPLNNIEIWTLTNMSPIAHPFHIHDVQFYITEINGTAPPANMAGKKDVVLVQAGQSVKFITKFESFCDSTATYMYHCHMLTHEDGGMMGQFNVICPKGVGISNRSIADEEIVVYPNPTKGKTIVKFSSLAKPISFTLLDSYGRRIMNNEQFNDPQLELDLNTYAPGIYTLMIYSAEGVRSVKVNLTR